MSKNISIRTIKMNETKIPYRLCILLQWTIVFSEDHQINSNMNLESGALSIIKIYF